jgi:hypothetical protein
MPRINEDLQKHIMYLIRYVHLDDPNNYNSHSTGARVTRLGECSPFGKVFTYASF